MTTQNDEILAKVRAFFLREELFAGRGERVCAAVSGGADSMALLLILLALREERGFELTVCHVNHGLRGEAADADEAFVREACARLGVPLRVFRAREMPGVQIPPHAGEDWARQLRYGCFEQLRAEGITAVATAHTGTDQAETLLFRLARGTGLHGAAGIRPKREGYIRPLLCLTRAETEAFCTGCSQPWVTDETNDSDAYARNRIRRGALPALETVNDAAGRNLARFCEAAARADAYFARAAQALLEGARVFSPEGLPAAARYAQRAGQPVWRLEPLRAADALILEAALHSLVAPVRDTEEKYVALLEALVRRGSGALQLSAKVRFCAGEGAFWREETPRTESGKTGFFQPFCPQTQTEYALPGGKTLESRLLPAPIEEKTQRVHKKDLKNQADYAKITTLHPAPVLRCRLAGDRYRPAGHGVNRELRKWMNEAGIPPKERDVLPLLASGSEVLWVCGAGFAEGLAPDAATRQLLLLEIKNREEA